MKSKSTWHPWNAHCYRVIQETSQSSPCRSWQYTLVKVSDINGLSSRHAGHNQTGNQTDKKYPKQPRIIWEKQYEWLSWDISNLDLHLLTNLIHLEFERKGLADQKVFLEANKNVFIWIPHLHVCNAPPKSEWLLRSPSLVSMGNDKICLTSCLQNITHLPKSGCKEEDTRKEHDEFKE